MSKLNPQKASAYVGPGVLRKGGKITPVPNGPLIKKKGPYAGSTLKSGGTIKKAQTGGTYYASSKGRVGRLSGSKIGDNISAVQNESIDTTGYSKGKKEFIKTKKRTFEKPSSEKVKREDVPNVISNLKKGATQKMDLRTPNQKKKSKMKAGGKIKKGQEGFKIGKYTYTIKKPANDTIKKPERTIWVNNPMPPSKTKKTGIDALVDRATRDYKTGGMIKRADGSYSKRGLWDNIRANKGSGKKPTAAMLKQERKIKAKK
jgi:hypothetical protein